MKCKTFKIHLSEGNGSSEEEKLNKFLENLNVHRIFSSIVNNEYWSVLIFYNDDAAANKILSFEETANPSEETAKLKAVGKSGKTGSAPDEQIFLNAAEEKIYAVLRGWRNEHSGRDGLPPYMIAHNDSLMLMAKNNPQTLDELMQIKGFGEKRAQKYGDEILQIIAAAKSEQQQSE